MYRIISARNWCQNSLNGLTLPSTCLIKSTLPKEITCSFCRKALLTSHILEKQLITRHQSTKTANAVKSLKKKLKYKGHKKYGELLAVNESSMTEMKVSISKLNAAHLTKLASSSVSLSQLHRLNTDISKKQNNIEVDKELLQTVRAKILKKAAPHVQLEDDKCALIFTNYKISSIEERLKTKQYINMVKESYYNFRKTTLYDQRLQDLRYAINEGVNQEFNSELSHESQELHDTNRSHQLPKSPHAVFRELFIEKNLDTFDQDLINHISNYQMQGLSHPAIDDICDDSAIQSDLSEIKGDLDIETEAAHVKTLKIKEAKQAIKMKKRKMREKRRAAKEKHMKQDLNEMEKKGKQETLHKLLAAHLQLLCSLNMMSEGRQVLQYYRQKSSRVPNHPKITDIKVFNTLLHGYASLGDVNNTEELLAFMAEDNIELNAQTYAAVFECIERSDLKDKYTVLHTYSNKMKEKGITLNDLLDKAKFLYDQHDVVIKAVRRVDPDFEPQYTPPILDYDCSLMHRLTLDKVENRKGLLTSPAQGVITFEELKEKTKKQFEMEMAGVIEVKNIAVKDEDSKTVKTNKEKLEAVESGWRNVIREAFLRNLSTLKSRSNASHSAINLYPYFKVLEVEEFVNLMMGEITKLVDGSESYSPTLNLLQRDLGTQVYHKYQMEQFRRNGYLKKLEDIYEKYCKWYLERHSLDGTSTPYNNRQAWQLLVHQNREGASLDIEETPWPMDIRQNIGKFLYNIIINDVKINVNMFKPKAKVDRELIPLESSRPRGGDFLAVVGAECRVTVGLLQSWRDRELIPLESSRPRGGDFLAVVGAECRVTVGLLQSWRKLLPAVYKVHRPWGRLVRLELKPHPALARLLGAGARPALAIRAALAPALAPPAPWRAPAAPAAYLLTDTPLVRMPFYITSQTKKLEETPPAQLYPALDSLNQLGEVPWVINKPILDLQLQVFRSGGDKKLDIPSPGAAVSAGALAALAPLSAHRRRAALHRARADMHSLWCDALYKLSLANHYREAVFWLPHNMDFRGRVYAVGPHVSALGADAARALLRLAARRPLGARGLRWLLLHAVSLAGTRKRVTTDQRLEYAYSIIDKILDSADHPLDGEGWWKESEEPWQTLACCMEIANAMRSPNPEEYLCGFPVHQDGSCNGLQHYAALGGDCAGAAAVNLAPAPAPQDVYSEVAALVSTAHTLHQAEPCNRLQHYAALGGDCAGAAAVNLAPAPAPQDVYSEVAALVETMRVRDAQAGVPAAIVLEGFVRRKVIKQTVMTTVYGVTRFGARLQIAKQLKDIDEFPKEHVWACSQYLTTKTFDSLREMFTSTKQIQDWFTDCAKVISGVCGESVEWVTPLGLPVLQPYYRRPSPSSHGPLELMQRPCTMKQRNAFPPNFIHSLDSSHMMLTGLHCAAAGLHFVSVHDCYWTHPSTVDLMNQICREQFVSLHSQPILEDLSKFMMKRYAYPESELDSKSATNKKRVNHLLQQVPEKGNFDISSVLDSVYFFS